MAVLVDLVVTLGMLVVVPVGLRLAAVPQAAAAVRLWPLFAVPGAVSLWLPRGAPAAALACCYAVGTLLPALAAPRRLAAVRSLAPAEVALCTALVSPAVAATALVAERRGHQLFGFDLEILDLTVPHFHFAGFAAALVAGLVHRAAPGRPLGTFAALSVPLGTLLVLLGYFVDDWAELAGAVVLTAGMWAVALLTWRDVRAGTGDRLTRALLAVSAGVLVATMLLALSWAVGEATGLPHPSLAWMTATHGLANALGFALCSLLAWRRLPARRAGTTAPDRKEVPA
ncbi:YndJ family protein [Streptomyces somaliensis DSM 40738]|uniref:YndJ family transporter n=1 Tax=Streptomyces somaliensis (strain ATCC 33201 / DSM 40738 / JCM 12659 / KCTC 9044 / NCTC 11332 / NRRL B-12077 / IP 733) TaxID=1134445 RepID=A0AA44DFQ3_STRE0|nr:YndJ family protein [Streptomyces somaliensis]MCQ0025486.1 YndJ family protein [Streptomyces somaliensis DSM 40738]NKY15455.1 YndJ family transporter [Streptomyces somaliensis DSM 40738]